MKTIVIKTIVACIAVFVILVCIWNEYNPYVMLDVTDILNHQINIVGWCLGFGTLTILSITDIENEPDTIEMKLKKANNMVFSMRGNMARMSKRIKELNVLTRELYKQIKNKQKNVNKINIIYNFTENV